MSWNTYVENLEKSGKVQKAAICGLDGSLWAASAGWNIKPEEVKTLNSCFTDKSTLFEKGMHVGNEKYICLGGDGDVIKGKKGPSGVHVSKSNTALIIGYYDAPIQHAQCAIEVDNIRDYLINNNY